MADRSSGETLAESKQPDRDKSALQDIPACIEDDVYIKLERHFLKQGKGRKPSLPNPNHLGLTGGSLMCSNKLLLQLRRIMVVGSQPYSKVSSWFKELYPDSSFPEDRVKSLIQKVEKSFGKITDLSAAVDFLKETFCVNSICPELDDIGIDWANIFSCSTFSGTVSKLTNQTVIALEQFRKKEKLKNDFVVGWVNVLMGKGGMSGEGGVTCSELNVQKTLIKCMNVYNVFLKQKHRNPEPLAKFLSDSFGSDQGTKQLLSEQERDVPVKVAPTVELQAYKKLHKEKEQIERDRDLLHSAFANSKDTITSLNELIANVSAAKEKLEVSLKDAEKQVESLQLKDTRQKKELDEKIEQLREKRGELKALKKSQLYKKNAKLRERHKLHLKEKQNLKASLAAAHQEINTLKAEKVAAQKEASRQRLKAQELELHALGLAELVSGEGDQSRRVETRLPECNRFTDDVRKTMIKLLETGIPASKCSEVVAITAKGLFHQPIPKDDLPSIQSVLNMADEGHVVSKLQAAEAMLKEERYTLHTDATSRDHNKIVGQQLTLSNGATLSLGFMGVDTETASNLLDLTINVLEELSDIYCWQHEETEKEAIFKEMILKLSSVVSDRAAVMKKFNTMLLEYKKSQLGEGEEGTDESFDIHFLYCNAHYLLGLSRACEVGMKKKEKEMSDSGLGRDCFPKFNGYKRDAENASSRLVRLASDCLGPRGDEKSGCRHEWQGFCDGKGKKSHITSYRANRFNCYFEGAAAIVHHRQDIIEMFDTGGLSHSNLKLESIEEDIKDNRLVALLAALGILYIRVTGPYWQLLQSDLPYTEFYKVVQKMFAAFCRWEQNASEMLEDNCPGLFDQHELCHGEVFDSVLKMAKDDSMRETVIDTLQAMMAQIKTVTQSQLADFLEGGKFGNQLPESVVSALSHCPLTNLLGENAFGDLDFDLSKRRHASLHYRSTTHMLKRNKTSKQLDKQTSKESEKMMKMARMKARTLRKKHRQQEKLVRIKIQEKVLENQRQKQLKFLKVAEMKQKIIAEVFRNGGPCMTAKDVSRLVRHCKGKQQLHLALKAEVRYQKMVLGVGGSLRLGGKLEDLIQSLKHHLQGNDDNDDNDTAEEEQTENAQALTSGKRKRANSSSDSESQETEVETCSETETEYETSERSEAFTFRNQGQWVAVFYDEGWYVGQVLTVMNENNAVIKFVQRTKGRCDFFRWPAREDIAEVEAKFVFNWDFDVIAYSSDGRVWKVPVVDKLEKAYARIKARG